MKISRQKQFVFVAIMIFIFFTVIAVALSPYFYSLMSPFNKRAIRIEGDFVFEGDEEVGYVASQNSSSHVILTDQGLDCYAYTDNRGARRNYMNFKSPEKVDIMAIGGSFFWGWMIKNEDTFLEILANDMEVKVANFALPSYGTLQSFQLLERNIDLNPKIIIYGFWLDHVRRNLCPFAPAICPFPRYVSYIDFDNQNNPYIHPPKGKYSKAFTKNFYEEVIHNPSIFGNIF